MVGSESYGQPTFAEAIKPETFTTQEQLDWCAANVPGEHPALALVAALTLRAIDVPVTPTTIRERLKATGRDLESLND